MEILYLKDLGETVSFGCERKYSSARRVSNFNSNVPYGGIYPHIKLYCNVLVITSPPEGVVRYCFHPACLCVCVCVRSIFWYFIYRLLEEISIWNLYRILNSIKIIDRHRSKVKFTGTVHCFSKVQSYHQKLSHKKNSIFSCRHLFVCPIKWNNNNLSEQRNDVTQNSQYLTFNM